MFQPEFILLPNDLIFIYFRLADESGIDLQTVSALIKKYNIETLGISEFNKVHKITNSAGMSDF